MGKQPQLKIVFAGTPEIAKVVLEKLLQENFAIELILTQPDRPSGRGMKITSSPVKQLALKHQLDVLQPVSLKKEPEVIERIRQLNPDIMIVVAYGLILPQTVLDIPRLGCVNIHVSLLPRWRGAAPIQRAVLAGDSKTGVTIMQMDAGLDTGDILLSHEVEIDDNETAGTLHDKIAFWGGQKIVEYLQNYMQIIPRKQQIAGVSYAEKITKDEGLINWHEPAELIARKMRGYNPYPGMYSYLGGQLYKFWASEAYVNCDNIKLNCSVGTVIIANTNELVIQCGEQSALSIQEIQQPGSKRKPIAQFMQAKHDLQGKCFGMML